MRYVTARARQEGYDRTYRSYITDAARIISQNTARTVENGIYIEQRFADIFDEQGEPEEEDTRSCTEIVADMWKALKGGNHDG